jgi:TM2 domain-containing membrane protein YozV
MNLWNLPKHIKRFDPVEFATGVKSYLVSVVLSLGLADILLLMICTFIFGIINIAGYYNHHLFKVKRKRTFYLSKLDQSTRNYGGNL